MVVKRSLSSLTSYLTFCMFMIRLSSFGHAFVLPTTRIQGRGIRIKQIRLYASSPKNVAIVGGGLAGLSTTYHLLKKSKDEGEGENLHITIFDKAEPGQGGASSVAGG